MSEKLFRFNPFNIKEWEDKEVVEQYGILENSLCFMDNPSGLANDIELYANMGYLIGEMIARYTELYSIKKVEVETTIDKQLEGYYLQEKPSNATCAKSTVVRNIEELVAKKLIKSGRFAQLLLQ